VRFLTGTVYSKALAIFLAAALGLLGAVAALTQLIILREFNQSERREMQAMLQRFSTVLARETLPLEAALGEWSRSADIKNFSEGKAAFPSEKIFPEALKELDVDFFGTFDHSGSLLRLVLSSKEDEALEQPLAEHLSQHEFVDWLKQDENQTGYILIGDKLCAVSSVALSSDAGGWLVAGKIFHSSSWGFLEGLFSATINFQTIRSTNVNETSGRDFMNLLNRQEIVIDPASNSQIFGYRLIKTLNGSPIGFVSISQARPLRQEGLHAIQIFLTGICLAGGALVIIVWILLDRTILARIKDLTRKLDVEKRSGRLPVKLNFRGEDELGVLARSIEDLAGALKTTQSLYRAVLEDQTESICRFDSEFRLTFANAIFERLFEIGNDSGPLYLSAILPEAAWSELQERFDHLTPEKALLSYSHEVSLVARPSLWFRSTLRRLYAPDGNSMGGQWVLADITAQVNAQRKMIESERRFRGLFESASDGLLLVEGNTLSVFDINPSLCRMLMIAGSEVLGRRLDALPVFTPCLDAVNSFRRKGGFGMANERRECRMSRADETSLFVELCCGAYDVDGAEMVQLSFRNVSDRVLSERELRRLSAKLLRLQDEERRRIARELHDSTAQNLSALEMNMSLLEPLVEGAHPRAARIVAETRQIAGECFRELRSISYLLHPPLIDEVGLAFAIKWFTDGFSKRTGIATTVEIDEGFPRLGSDIEMPLFRVVQEALTNIYRHSGADHAWVRLQHEERLMHMEIRDNGRGFGEGVLLGTGWEKERPTGVGLAGMKERLAHVGGTLEIENSPLGVTLTIRLPLGAEDIWQEERVTEGG
jgi:signal transduction histidine kinase/sensor domain CHASE-containing protein